MSKIINKPLKSLPKKKQVCPKCKRTFYSSGEICPYCNIKSYILGKIVEATII